jgi:hypothetical protein
VKRKVSFAGLVLATFSVFSLGAVGIPMLAPETMRVDGWNRVCTQPGQEVDITCGDNYYSYVTTASPEYIGYEIMAMTIVWMMILLVLVLVLIRNYKTLRAQNQQGNAP